MGLCPPSPLCAGTVEGMVCHARDGNEEGSPRPRGGRPAEGSTAAYLGGAYAFFLRLSHIPMDWGHTW